MNDLIIGDDYDPGIHDSPNHEKGLIPRDYSTYPRGCYAAAKPIDIPLIPRSEWPDLIRRQTESKSRLSDIRDTGNYGKPIPSLDQNGSPFCWAHSTTGAVQMLRAIANQPYVPLSAYAVACKIKNFRQEGGWGALSLDFIMEHGVPSQQFWPQQSMDRSHDNPTTWENALLHKVTDGFIDLAEPVYSRDLSFDQEATLLLSRVPVIKDENWWGHSILGLDLVEVDPSKPLSDIRRWGVRILNSWGDSWGTNGTAVLSGKKAVSDGAVAPLVTNASPI